MIKLPSKINELRDIIRNLELEVNEERKQNKLQQEYAGDLKEKIEWHEKTIFKLDTQVDVLKDAMHRMVWGASK